MSVFKVLTFLFLAITVVGCSSKPKKVVVPRKKETVANVVKEEKKEPKKTIWGYAGDIGPKSWSELSPDYALCREGKEQSPIDLVWKQPESKTPIQFDYKPTAYEIVNNGHGIQINLENGNTATINGEPYTLFQMHLHSPSEHTISGRWYDAELHLVHRNARGEVAMIGVLYLVGSISADLALLLPQLPQVKGVTNKGQGKIDPMSFIPYTKTHYRYQGSLTKPPCSEGVTWTVYNTPKTLSANQLEKLRELYYRNYRPVQPVNGRKVHNY